MDTEFKVVISIIAIIFVIGITVGLIATGVEQKTFNRFSDEKVSFVEALFTDLRVIPDRCK